jgi:hypothetical protein
MVGASVQGIEKSWTELQIRFPVTTFVPNRMQMNNTRIFKMPFAKVYPMYVQKAEKKGRTQAEVDAVIFWLTGYDEPALRQLIDRKTDFETFFAQAPLLNPNVSKITGVICGYRVEEIEDPLMQKIRYLDKLVDELAKGKKLEFTYLVEARGVEPLTS